jgi:hypothetical protein
MYIPPKMTYGALQITLPLSLNKITEAAEVLLLVPVAGVTRSVLPISVW